jgi:hypothetical protein
MKILQIKHISNLTLKLPHKIFCHNSWSYKQAPKWTWPNKILHLKGDANVEIQLKHNGRKTAVHANRLKPYFVASKNLAAFPDILPTMNMHQPCEQQSQPLDDQNFPEPEDYSDAHLSSPYISKDHLNSTYPCYNPTSSTSYTHSHTHSHFFCILCSL